MLAAPIAVLHEAYANMADEGEDLIIVSGKRAEEGGDSWTGYHGLTQASPDSGSMSVQLSSQHPRGSASEYAGGVHQETKNLIFN